MRNRVRRKYQKLNVGEIYYVHYKHLVKPEKWATYALTKGRKANNLRPVVVSVQRRGKHVQISNMTHQASQQQLLRQQKVKLKDAQSNEASYVDTNTISRSRMTNRKFAIGEAPLVSSSKRLSSRDLSKLNKARRRRGR